MLIQIPDTVPVMSLIEFATSQGYQVKWTPDDEIKAELLPFKQPQPAEASSEVGV